MNIIDVLTNIFENTEGANKCLKIVQCLSNIIEYIVRVQDKEKYVMFASKISQARKMFKLFKFINEIPRLIYLIETPLDNFTKNFNFMTRLFNSFFYIFENLSIFTTTKLIDQYYRTHLELLMSLSWLLTQIFHMSY